MNGNTLTVNVPSGGTVTVIGTFRIMALTADERRIVSAIADAVQELRALSVVSPDVGTLEPPQSDPAVVTPGDAPAGTLDHARQNCSSGA